MFLLIDVYIENIIPYKGCIAHAPRRIKKQGSAADSFPPLSVCCALQLPPASKQTKALDLALFFTTALGLAFPNLTPVWLPGRGQAPHHGATLGRTSPEDSASDSPRKPQRISTWQIIIWYELIAGEQLSVTMKLGMFKQHLKKKKHSYCNSVNYLRVACKKEEERRNKSMTEKWKKILAQFLKNTCIQKMIPGWNQVFFLEILMQD